MLQTHGQFRNLENETKAVVRRKSNTEWIQEKMRQVKQAAAIWVDVTKERYDFERTKKKNSILSDKVK